LLNLDGSAALPQDDMQILHGQIFALRAQHAFFSNQNTRAIELSQEALALLPRTWTFGRGGAMLFLSLAMQASGQALAAERLLLEQYEATSDKTQIYALMLLRSLSFIYLTSGELEQARQSAQVLLKNSTRSGVVIMKNWSDWFLGVIYYQRSELAAAEQHFSEIVENRYTVQITTLRDAVAGLALIHQRNGEWHEAQQLVESISQLDLEQRGSEDTRTRSLRARLLLLQGDLQGAGQWVDTFTDLPPDQPIMWLEEPQITRVRILAARGGEADLTLALRILEVLDEIVGRTYNARFKIEIQALRSLVLDAQGKSNDADTVLGQAVNLARAGSFIQGFADLGKPMWKMLHRLLSQGYVAETIQRILAAFPQDDKDLVGRERLNLPRRTSAYDNLLLLEPLTPRELEVLSLLRGPASIKEIARKLDISPATVKRHTINIYGKLGVNKRWNAVARAEELNILPPR
jgi:LuxR family transcriptional regulator, maltose regulon positive regulatory protein